FGNSVSISGNTIAVGAIFAPTNFSFEGKGYVFVRPASGWSGNLTETAELRASDTQLLNYFGASIAISGNTVVVGAPNARSSRGTAYVFVQPSSGWVDMTETAELVQPNAMQSNGFGQSTGISGNVVAVGAPGTTVGGNSGQGAEYVFIKPSTGWKNT